jgi:hypothetical protein
MRTYIRALLISPLIIGCNTTASPPVVVNAPVPYAKNGAQSAPKRIPLGSHAKPTELSRRSLMRGVNKNTALLVIRNQTGQRIGEINVGIHTAFAPPKGTQLWNERSYHGKGALLNGGARIIKAQGRAPGDIELFWTGSCCHECMWRSAKSVKGGLIKGGTLFVVTIWPQDKVTAHYRYF